MDSRVERDTDLNRYTVSGLARFDPTPISMFPSKTEFLPSFLPLYYTTAYTDRPLPSGSSCDKTYCYRATFYRTTYSSRLNSEFMSTIENL